MREIAWINDHVKHLPLLLAVLVFLCLVIVVFMVSRAIAGEEEELEASAGADASNPMAAVNFQDISYRYFDLSKGREMHSFETESAYMFHPRLKFTNELRGVNTNRGGDWETDWQELQLRAIFLTDGKPLGIKVKYALGIG